jgi:hypothetical protein
MRTKGSGHLSTLLDACLKVKNLCLIAVTRIVEVHVNDQEWEEIVVKAHVKDLNQSPHTVHKLVEATSVLPIYLTVYH